MMQLFSIIEVGLSHLGYIHCDKCFREAGVIIIICAITIKSYIGVSA